MYFQCTYFSFLLSPLLLQSPFLKHLLLPPLYCFKSAHLVSLASISLSPTPLANIPPLHTPKSSSALSGLETRLFFSLMHQDTGVFLCWFPIAKLHSNILVLSEIILRTPVMLRTELISNKFSNQPLIKLYIIHSVIFSKFLSWLHTQCFHWGAYMHVFDTTYPMP